MSGKTNLETAVIISLFLLAVMSSNLRATGNYDGGDGSPSNPFQIRTAAQMNEIGTHPEDWTSCFILTADIDLSSYTGTSFHIIGKSRPRFTGVFDGNDHEIFNFTYESLGESSVGLFAYTKGNALIKNVGLRNPHIDVGTGLYVGSLVGVLGSGMVFGCYAESSNVSGNQEVGGLVGTSSGTISNCYSTGTVSGPQDTGGLVGQNDGIISESYSSATVLGEELTGGLVGHSGQGQIINCYSTGNVFGSLGAGGLVGCNFGTITKCYAAASVSDDYDQAGGLVGHNVWETALIEDSFWDTEKSGRSNMCGTQIYGACGCNNACGKTTAQMQMESTFTPAGWDFENVWHILEGRSYPLLRNVPVYVWYIDNDAPNDLEPNNPDVSDPNEDGSAKHPFDNIQEAIDVARHGDTVIVLSGTYTGAGNHDVDFGGKAITVRSTDPNNAAVVAGTVIDCEGSSLDPHRGFYFHSGETASSVLAGLTISNGYADNGGGVRCEGSSPTIKNCVFSGNAAEYDGGGIRNYNCSSLMVTNCVFTGNTAYWGGGIENCWSSTIVTNCIFAGNTASLGGGIENWYGSPVIINCTFSGNVADANGGGMYNECFSSATVTDCILWSNTASVDGNEIALADSSTTDVNYCDVAGGQASIYDDGSGNTIIWGDNIDSDPCFVDPGYWADVNDPNIVVEPNDPNAVWVDGDYHLRPGSPCIDAGDNNSVPPDSTDLDNDGNTAEPLPWDLDSRNRFADGDCNDSNVVDMGAYEFNYAYIGDFDGQCDVDFADYAIFALAWLTEQGDGQYNPACDISIPADQYIDWRDLDVLTDNWLAAK